MSFFLQGAALCQLVFAILLSDSILIIELCLSPLNSFCASVPLAKSLKTSENQKLHFVFKGQRKRAYAKNVLSIDQVFVKILPTKYFQDIGNDQGKLYAFIASLITKHSLIFMQYYVFLSSLKCYFLSGHPTDLISFNRDL